MLKIFAVIGAVIAAAVGGYAIIKKKRNKKI